MATDSRYDVLVEPPPVAYRSVDPFASAADDGHVRAIAICHYVWGGLMTAGALFPVLYIGLGILMMTGAMQAPASAGGPSSAAIGWMFIIFGSVFFVILLTLGLLTIFSGRAIAKRRKRTFSLVIAAINCASFPLGTVLGVFTFIVLLRPSVSAAYAWREEP